MDTLPDPLRRPDGTQIVTAAEWEAHRPELLTFLTREMYGRPPMEGHPPQMTCVITADDPTALNHTATRRQIAVHFDGHPDGPSMEKLLYIPNQAARPVPVFVALHFGGVHTVSHDPCIVLPVGLDADAPRGSASSRWPVETILARGYALAVANYNDIALDNPAAFRGSGVLALCPNASEGDDHIAAVGTWAWGLSRLLDYLGTDPLIDARRAVAFGHSRLGKAALWAGATDPRFALVISNESGAGGAKLFQRGVGESIRRLNTVFPHWFTENFTRYTDQDTTLPWDQHWVLALIAPRPVYVASAIEDANADPEGEFAGARAADPVYRLLTGDGLPSGYFPATDTPLLGGRIGYHVRSGKHDVTAYDWEQYLDFVDRHLSTSRVVYRPGENSAKIYLTGAAIAGAGRAGSSPVAPSAVGSSSSSTLT